MKCRFTAIPGTYKAVVIIIIIIIVIWVCQKKPISSSHGAKPSKAGSTQRIESRTEDHID